MTAPFSGSSRARQGAATLALVSRSVARSGYEHGWVGSDAQPALATQVQAREAGVSRPADTSPTGDGR